VSGRSEFVERALARLLPMGPVRARARFGGWGLFLDDGMCALIAGERLYFKGDAETEADNRFKRAHPDIKVPDESVLRHVQAH